MIDALLAEFDTTLGTVPPGLALLRMVMALLLGGIIGWEREHHARAAGLRTHMMISLAACLFTLIATELSHFRFDDEVRVNVDPLRLIEAVTSGVAFLAAGSIVISGANVRGITTGASMWMVGAVGLCCGTGDLWLASMATALAMTVLWLVRLIAQPVRGGRQDDDSDRGGQATAGPDDR